MFTETNKRTVVKAISYRTAVAISIFFAAIAMQHSAGFGLTFIILSYTVGFFSFYIQERIWNLFQWQRKGKKDTQIRSLAKTVTWRIWSFFVLMVVGIWLGLETNDAAEWSIVTNILFFVVHYLHERLWNSVNWGKNND